jgi:hypothetical protein
MLLWNVPFAEFAEKIRKGVFGDSLGTLNALFSGLAFSGVLITLLFQRKDLSETRTQIANQQVESQFYSMLAQQQEIVRGLDLQNRKSNEVISRGRDCFREWADSLVNLYAEIASSSRFTSDVVTSSDALHEHEDEDEDEHVRLLMARALFSASSTDEAHSAAYSLIFEIYRADLSLYYRSLYSVFRFIENSNYKDKSNFGLVVRSLISDYELVFMFYNCLTERGEKFKRYVYRFALFDNLDPGLLLNKEHVNFFTYEAYGSNRAIIESLKVGPPAKG